MEMLLASELNKEVRTTICVFVFAIEHVRRHSIVIGRESVYV